MQGIGSDGQQWTPTASNSSGGGLSGAAGAALDLASAGLGKLKGATDQMGIPGAGLVTMNMPKSVTDQISSLQGSSSVVTGESHFLEVGGLLPSRNTAL